MKKYIYLIALFTTVAINFSIKTDDFEFSNIQESTDPVADLKHAIVNSNYKKIKKLLHQNPGISLEEDELTGNTLLHSAINYNNKQAMNLLLKDIERSINNRNLDIELDIENSRGFTPLILSIAKGDRDTVKKLLSLGANPNHISKQLNRDTPLHRAVIYDRPKIAKLLIKYGADPEIKNANKKTPFELDINQETQEKVEKFYHTIQETLRYQLASAFDTSLKNNKTN